MGITITVPYGRSVLHCTIPDGHFGQFILPTERFSRQDQSKIVQDALSHPIGSPTLQELSASVRKILLITDDNTRPLPSKITIPCILGALARPPQEYEITILIATGLHREMAPVEIEERFGRELMDCYPIVNHHARDREDLISLGMLSTGNELWVNRLVAESDLVIAEGFIEPHFFAGFSGGRKSILPGVSGADTILRNHSPQNIGSRSASIASLSGNPIHAECTEAAQRAGLRFILNVALNQRKEIVCAYAGDPTAAHAEGCSQVQRMMSVPVRASEIVITSNNGYPLDRNLYQTVKGIDTAARAVREGGTIIIASQCADGVGHPAFEQLLTSFETVEQLDRQMRQGEAVIDQWQVQVLARVLRRNRVILVSDTISQEQAGKMFLQTAPTLQAALDVALKAYGPHVKVNVMPDGPVVIPQAV
jgi:nickel-dependent lactate racemase